MSRSATRTVHLEGNFFSYDFLDRVATLDPEVSHLSSSAYGLGETGRIRETVAQVWNNLSSRFTRYQAELTKLPENDFATAVTRREWLLPLLDQLGFGRVQSATSLEAMGKEYAISHGWNQTPIHLLGDRVPLDKRTPGLPGAAQTAPHALVQELLNRSDAHLWAIVSNGRKLRLLRDSANIARQSFVEFDLQAIFENEDAPAFALLWLLCHATRFENDGAILEGWQQNARQQGQRALERLRVGVEGAIKALGSGFLAHRANTGLREALRDGTLTNQDFYRETLRIVYRMLFLLVAETKGALLLPAFTDEERKADPDGDAERAAARARYTDYFALSNLKTKAGKRKGDSHHDLWQGLRLPFQLLREGEPRLALPALGGFLFEKLRFDECDISNRDLLEALRHLTWFKDESGSRREVNFNLGSEELGSVYESLLELTPDLDIEARSFELRTLAGNERKTTGSYYTPEILVKSLLESALEPLLERASHETDREAALLRLSILDPACGSGHFLTAAARRVARELAFVRSQGDEPSLETQRTAIRDVISHCVYAIDLNPMAVELCKVALWMEALEPGKPLSFLDSHIRCGNALLGTTPELLEDGIPDAAFAVLEGDDKGVISALKKVNRAERAGQRSLFARPHYEMKDLSDGFAEVELASQEDIAAVREKEVKYSKWLNSAPYRHTHMLADAWCAAFVWHRAGDLVPDSKTPITQDDFEYIRDSRVCKFFEQGAEIKRLADLYQWFHPHIEFPLVMKKGGFDLVIGNPPWERIKLQEKEWFATRAPEIANAPNASRRKQLIDALSETEGGELLYQDFLDARRRAEGESHFARSSGRYPLCGVGDVNTYALFAEANRNFIGPKGRVGCIVPSGIATDDTTKAFFGSICDTHQLASLYDIENREKVFPDVDSRFKFCLLTLSGVQSPVAEAQFVFFAHNDADLNDPGKRFSLSAADIALLNPNTKTCPIFRSTRDAELTKAIYGRVPVLVNESVKIPINPWRIYYLRLVHFSDHRKEIAYKWDKGEAWSRPVYEAKLLNLFDHRFATFEGASQKQIEEGKPILLKDAEKLADLSIEPRYFVRQSFVDELFAKYPEWQAHWIMVWRDVARSNDERSCITSVIPRTAASVKCPGIGFDSSLPSPSLFANLSSFILDYGARQKIGGISLSYYVFKQLPVLPPSTYDTPAPWTGGELLRDWISRRVVELCYTAYDLTPFARDCGYDGGPFPWDPERRFQLRCELDAAFFHLYGLTRDEADYVMETFPIVKSKDVKAHGSYRTKERILGLFGEYAS